MSVMIKKSLNILSFPGVPLQPLEHLSNRLNLFVGAKIRDILGLAKGRGNSFY